MDSNNGGLHFDVGLDLTQLRQDATESRNLLNEIGTTATQQGEIIDRAIGTSGAAYSFTVLEAAIAGAGKQIQDMEFGSAEEKIGALSYIIQENENVLAQNIELLDKYRQDAAEAFASGDTGTLQAINADIADQIAKVNELTEETQTYRNTLSAVMEANGMGTSTVEVPRLYDSEEDIRHVEELRESIANVSAEIARVGQDGGDTTALTASLSEMREELGECELGAAQAAAALGEDLGGRASDAQQQLHALNQAIEEQQTTIDTLTTAVEEARTKMEELQQSEDASTQDVEMATTSYDTLSESLRNAQEQMIALQTQQQTAQANWDAVTQEVQSHDSVMVQMLGGYDNYKAILDQLPGPLKSAANGITGMTGAAKAFIATPLGACLAAIILALESVKTWLDSTAEGQMAFAEASGYVSGVLGQLKEIVIAVGNALYKAFKDPKQALSDLGQAIKNNLANRVQALGEEAKALGTILKSALTLDFDGIKKGWKDMSSALLKFTTGVDDLGGKVKDWASSVNTAASATAQIKVEERELEVEVSKWQIKKQELEKTKAEARGKMYNSSLSTAERKAAQKEFEDALSEEMATEKKYADKRVELQQRTMALTSNTIEDENKLRQLQAERAALDTQQATQLASLQRRAGSIANQEQTAANKAEKAIQTRQQALQKLGEMEASLILSNQERELELMEEGHQKRMDEITLERDQELQELEKTKTKLAELNRKAGVATGEDGLTDIQRTEILNGRTNIEKNYQKGVQAILEDELADILTYEQRRLKITEEYEQKRRNLYETDANGNYITDSNGNNVLRAGVSEGNVDELERQEDQVMAALDEEFAQREDTYQAWCNQIATMTLEQLTEILQQAQEELARMEEDEGADSTSLAVARAKVATAQENVSKASAKVSASEDTSPDERSIEEWEELGEALNNCCKEFEEIGDEIDGLAGDILSTAGQIASSALSMVSGILQLTQTSTTAVQSTATAASKAIQTVERASVILTIISAALQIANQIASLFNNDDEKQEEIEKLQQRIDQLQWELDNADTVRLQEEAGSAIENVRNALQATYDELASARIALNDYTGAWKTLHSTVKSNVELLEASAEKLATYYSNISYSADKAFGEEKFSSAREELENIAQQQLLIQQQIEEEEDKKDTDQDKIADWEQEIEELGEEAVSVINDMVEEIIGGSATDIAEQLGDAFFDAFQAGEDYAEAWGEAVDDIVSDVIKNMLVSKYLEEPLGEIFDKYKDKWFSDGEFAGIDAVVESMSSFASDLESVGEDFEAIWDALPDSIKNMITVTDDATREASSSGIATASQESVDELNGRATVIQSHTYSMNENVKLMLTTANLILQSILNIEKYTETINTNMASVTANVKEVKDTVNEIHQKGITLR